MPSNAPHSLPTAPQSGVGVWVVGAVVLLHLGVMWVMQVGLGRESEPEPAAPTVVVGRLILRAASAPQPVQPLALPAKTAVPQATLAPMSKAEVSEPAPVSPPAAAVEALPAVAATTASMATATATVALAPFASTGFAPAVAHTSAPAVRVGAVLQASGTCQKPGYPELSSRREEEGTVHLKFLIGVDGRVLESQIEKSSGYPRLDEAARAGLSLCQFKPGTVDGKPEVSWAEKKYTWRLD